MSHFLSDVGNESNTTENIPDNYGFPPPWTSDQFLYLVIISNTRIALCVLAFFANGLVLLLQIIKLKSFLKTQYVFASSLSIADGVYSVGVLFETFVFVYDNEGISPVPFSAMATAGHFHSYVSVILVAVDRYLALCAFPIRYKTIVSLKKYYVISTLCWCFSLAYGFVIRYAFPPGHYFGSLETFITPSVAIIIYCVIYLKLYLSTSRSMRQTFGHLGQREIKRRNKLSRKLLLAITLILLTNFVLLMPSRVFNFYLFLDPIRFSSFKNILLANVFYNLQTLNAVVNPLIYWWQVILRDGPRCRLKMIKSNPHIQTIVDSWTRHEGIELAAVNLAVES